jgi:hypothetical protein
MKKRKGERGFPCIIPLKSEKGCEGAPLTRIEKKVKEMRFIIQAIQFVLKPKDVKTTLMYCQLNLSKYFERSRFSSIPGVVPEFVLKA